jgi:flagellar motor switch protein FliG
MERDKAAALRRVAIVLSSLPEATSKILMSNLGPEHQRSIRAAIGGLVDVDPLERRRALDGFKSSIRQGRSSLAGQNDAAEIVFSKVAMRQADARDDRRVGGASGMGGNGGTGPDEPVNAASPFAFLSDVDDDVIAMRVKDEHPQTVAIILASIAPGKAARLLAKLGVGLRSDAMRRLAKLDYPPAEMVEEIASQLKQRLVYQPKNGETETNRSHWAFGGASAQPLSATGKTAGAAALQAILAEMAGGDGNRNAAAESHQPPRGDHLGYPAHSPSRATSQDDRRSAATIFDRSHASAVDAAFGEPSPRHDQRQHDPQPSTEAIHAILLATPPSVLRQALANIDGRDALLALCGLPNTTAESILGSLPRRQARQIRQQMASLGGLELREVDRAKELVADEVQRLMPATSIPMRKTRDDQAASPAVRFAAA